MRRILTTFLFVPFLPMPATAQDCATGRYHTPGLFSEVTVTQGVAFGSNTGFYGGGGTNPRGWTIKVEQYAQPILPKMHLRIIDPFKP